MYSLIFLIQLICLFSSANSMDAYNMIPSSVRAQQQGLTGFTLNFMNFSGAQKLIMFGGIINTAAQNTMIQIQPKTGTGSVMNISGGLPPSRRNHCSLVFEYKMYIFGGVGQSGEVLTDLWEFNNIFASWTQISQASLAISKCSIIRNNTNIIIMGINGANQLTIMKYSLLNNDWARLTYSYGYAIVREGQQWDGSTKQTLITIQNISPYDSFNQSNIRYTSKFTTETLCIQKHTVDNTYLIVTDCKILVINFKTMKINLVRLIQSSTQQYNCLVSSEWLFVIKVQNGAVLLNHYLLNNFNVIGSNSYDIPESKATFKNIIIDSNIYFVSELSLNAWILYHNCANTPYPNIKTCFYGQIHCKQGYRGATCSQAICPNTLSLIDEFNNDQIFYQCSNHGTCTPNGCVCDQYWSGEDCSMYTRSACRGQLVQNWPVMNCECEQQTLGGNACEVKFCYNDCSDHGKCLINGKCICDAGYYGDDCSITIIQFPGSSTLEM